VDEEANWCGLDRGNRAQEGDFGEQIWNHCKKIVAALEWTLLEITQ